MPLCAIKRGIALLLPLAILAGCASTPKLGGDPNLKIIPASGMPAPDRMDLTAGARSYVNGGRIPGQWGGVKAGH